MQIEPISKREFFAAHVLQGLVTNSSPAPGGARKVLDGMIAMVDVSFVFADLMIEETRKAVAGREE